MFLPIIKLVTWISTDMLLKNPYQQLIQLQICKEFKMIIHSMVKKFQTNQPESGEGSYNLRQI